MKRIIEKGKLILIDVKKFKVKPQIIVGILLVNPYLCSKESLKSFWKKGFMFLWQWEKI